MTNDYIIVGQGLAGTLTAFALMKAGKKILVIDEDREITSSKICGGMFTPISGKRMVKTKDTDVMLASALETYGELEQLLGIKLLTKKNIYAVFGSVKEQNDLSLKAEDSNFSKHIRLDPVPEKNIRQPYGAFEISGSGWVNVKLLLQAFREKLISEQAFIKEKFDYAALKNEGGKWTYKNIQAYGIIFCEGIQAKENPYFMDLPFRFCKGDILTIRCEELQTDRVIKKGIGILPVEDHVFKVGSTYEWSDLSNLPTEAGRNTLTQKLDGLLEVPYMVLKHEAAVRPSTKTREVLIKQHPEFNNMFLLNGLGTKGVANAPWSVGKLMEKIS